MLDCNVYSRKLLTKIIEMLIADFFGFNLTGVGSRPAGRVGATAKMIMGSCLGVGRRVMQVHSL